MVGDLFAGGVLFGLVELGLDLLQALIWNPVDGEFGFVTAGFEDAGPPGGELEYGWAAESPVGDQ